MQFIPSPIEHDKEDCTDEGCAHYTCPCVCHDDDWDWDEPDK